VPTTDAASTSSRRPTRTAQWPPPDALRSAWAGEARGTWYGPAMLTSLRGTAALLGTLAILGCGCGGGGGGGGSSPIPLADLPSNLKDISCTRAVACGEFADQATCLASTAIDLGQITASVNAGKTKYDAAAAGKCLGAMRKSIASACTLSGRGSTPSDPSCEEMFNGTVADGAPCFASDECISTSCNFASCTGGTMCCAGICDPTVPGKVALGGDCTAPASRCIDGTYCHATSPGAAGTCAAFLAAGQPCTPSAGDQCSPDLLCVQTPTQETGTCAMAPGRGQPCTLFCNAEADYCSMETMKCEPRIAVGGACPLGFGCVF